MATRSEKAKLTRRLRLLDDLLDCALRSGCQFSMCNGPGAPIRHMQTCSRCACITRAEQMGLIKRQAENEFVTVGGNRLLVMAGALQQVSVIDGSRV